MGLTVQDVLCIHAALLCSYMVSRLLPILLEVLSIGQMHTNNNPETSLMLQQTRSCERAQCLPSTVWVKSRWRSVPDQHPEPAVRSAVQSVQMDQPAQR